MLSALEKLPKRSAARDGPTTCIDHSIQSSSMWTRLLCVFKGRGCEDRPFQETSGQE